MEKSRKHLHLSVLALAVALLVLWLSRSLVSQSFDYLYHDFLQRLYIPGAAEDIVVVAVDDASLSALGRWPWQRDLHAQLINQLTKAKADAILLDIIFAEPNRQNPLGDQRLSRAMAANGKVVLPAFLDQHSNQGQLVEVLPYGEFSDAAARIGHVHVDLDFDGVVRHFYQWEGLGEARWQHIAAETYGLLYDVQNEPNKTDGGPEPNYGAVRTDRKFIRYVAGPGEYLTVSYKDVLTGEVPLSTFTNKIVLVGATAKAIGDQLATPVSHSGLLLSGIELNANILENYRRQLFVSTLPDFSLICIHLAVALLPLIFLPRLSPNRALVFLISYSALILVATAQIFRWQGVWVPMSPALIGLIALYLLFTWRRLVMAITYLESESERLSELIAQHRMNPMTQPKEIASFQTVVGHSQKVTVSHESHSEESLKPQRDLFGGTIQLLQQSSRDVESLHALFESTLLLLSDGVLVWDEEGRVLFINENFLKGVEVHKDIDLYEMNALSVLELFELNESKLQWSQILRECHRDHKAFHGEMNNRKSEEFLVSIEQVTIGEGEQALFIACITDITTLKNAQKERHETIHFLSHDLRSPMVSILALLEHAKINPNQNLDEAGLLTLFSKIEGYTKKNLDFAEKFLHLARLENREKLSFVEQDLSIVIDNAIEHLYWLAQQKSIAIEFSTDDEWALNMVPDLIERMFINLLENAIKYCPPGSKVVVSLRSEKVQGELKTICRLEDNGPGVPANALPFLFDRFSQVNRDNRNSGVGLGLRFVKVVMARHHGDIRAFNVASGGTCFELTF